MSENDLRRRIRLGVIGGARPAPRFEDIARDVGRRIAEAGAILICGGLGGVMQAAARGAREAGGLTIGILPGLQPDEANPFIDIPVATGIGYARNAAVAMNADALIAVDGEFGTLSEIAFGRIYGKPVVGIETWDIPGVEPAADPAEAVEKALRFLRAGTAGPRRGRK